MFSVPKVLERWINPFHLASFTCSPHLFELKLRAIHLEKPINYLFLEAPSPLSLVGSHLLGLEPSYITAVSISVLLGLWVRQEGSPNIPAAPSMPCVLGQAGYGTLGDG